MFIVLHGLDWRHPRADSAETARKSTAFSPVRPQLARLQNRCAREQTERYNHHHQRYAQRNDQERISQRQFLTYSARRTVTSFREFFVASSIAV